MIFVCINAINISFLVAIIFTLFISMALSCFTFLSIASHLLMFMLAVGHEYNSETTKCCESFECGSLGNMSYPFFKSTDSPDCGVYKVDCDAKLPPKIKLYPEDYEDEYSIIRLPPVNTTPHSIHVGWLNKESCWNFIDFSVLNTSSISFTVPSNITLFKCFQNQTSSDDPFPGYEKSDLCKHSHGFTLYFKNSHDTNTSPTASAPLQHHCSTVVLPLAPRRPNSPPGLPGLLADQFEMKWNASCDCRHRDVPCLIEWNQLGCSNEGIDRSTPPPINKDDSTSRTHKKVQLIICLVSAAVVLILVVSLATFIVWRCRRTNSLFIASTNKSSAPFSRRDSETWSSYTGISVFTYNELEQATNGFDSSKELGDGGFGIVYYGKLQDGREVAIKRLYEHNYKRVEQFMNEIRILTSLNHPNLVSLYGCTSRRNRELLLVYEYVPNGTVADHLHGYRQEKRLLSWPIRMKIAIQTASALAYLHASDIIHRDVKTNNILLDQNFSVKVADFGLSRLFPLGATHVSTAPQGTPGYVDPEYHECYQLTDKSDVYSFGVILIELISSMPAVDISRHRQEINLANLAIDRIQRCAYDELVDLWLGYATDPEVKRMTTAIAELAFRCLQLDKELRPTMDEVLEALEGIKKNN